jgi:DNA processing protein
VILAPTDLAYPVRLANLRTKRTLRISGPLDHHGLAVAIVGSRHPTKEAAAFAGRLAKGLARAGVLVVSGGAIGIDATAHEAALAEGRTWCVAPNGRRHPYPQENADLFERIAASSGSRMIWPFDDDQEKDAETPKQRNEILVALAKAVVVIQAHLKSGSRNAITHARRMRRPLFIVPASPWMPSFAGSMWELSRGGARALCHESQLYRFLGIAWPGPSDAWTEAARVEEQPSLPNLEPLQTPETAVDQPPWTRDEISIFSALCDRAQHVDDVVARTGLPTSATITALLTLSLKDVVVEGPDGFFRRR